MVVCAGYSIRRKAVSGTPTQDMAKRRTQALRPFSVGAALQLPPLELRV
jgi:hypothetical protein